MIVFVNLYLYCFTFKNDSELSMIFPIFLKKIYIIIYTKIWNVQFNSITHYFDLILIRWQLMEVSYYIVLTVLIILTWNFEYENGCVEGNS